MDARAAALRWAEAWERSWRTHDPAVLRAVYAEDCVFRSSPFREPELPWEYAAWAYGDEESAEPRFAEPVTDGDQAVVAWWATVVNADGTRQTLAGSSHLRFDGSGLVVEDCAYWNAADGHVAPFVGWSRPDG